ncbi:MAG TPA: (d)CMP kinase [Clostridiales bacterium]|nr:MAG: cytidylate kinase [Clostridiales bacterium GWD2_32_59]HAN09850.1 (d)CMP kinase [Clostridiales bacterium]
MIEIAIDGPAGAGKSTISKITAGNLKLLYIDTGAMFRAVTFYFISNNIDYENEESVNKYIDDICIELKHINGIQHIYLNGNDVTKEIRTEEISKAVSVVAKNQKIREMLLDIQRKIAKENNVVMDGRDIGTCVLPNAGLKIFLVASVEERARRRYKQLVRRGKTADYDEILVNLKKRDEQDMTREIAPLKKANDAIIIDSTNMTLEKVVKIIVTLANERF